MNYEKFWAKVEKTNSCWLWNGSVREGGRPQYGGKTAYRIAYEVYHGEFDPRKKVLHTCGNNLCVNPQHLRLGNKLNIFNCKFCGEEYAGQNAQFCSLECRGSFQTTNWEKKFWPKVSKTNGCWEWIGGKFTNGYGILRIGNKSHLAHRLSYQLANPNEDISEKVLLHHCDNKKCVNPAHLSAGSHSDNMHDMWNKIKANKKAN